MNKKRRAALDKLIIEIDELSNRLMEFQAQEEEAYDNLPEALQDAEKGEAMYAAAEKLEEAASYLNDAVESIKEAVQI